MIRTLSSAQEGSSREVLAPEAPVLGYEELQASTAELLSSLHNAVGQWQQDGEDIQLNSGNTLRNYSTVHPGAVEGRETRLQVQLAYPNATATTPVFGNVTCLKTSPGRAHEYYVQVSNNPDTSESPLIYAVDFPFHQDAMGTPDVNTASALSTAQKQIKTISQA